MSDRPADGDQFPQDRDPHPDAALGGADAVQKTTYVTGSGTEPETVKPDGEKGARAAAGGGQGATWAIIVFLLVGAVLVYLMGFAR